MSEAMPQSAPEPDGSTRAAVCRSFVLGWQMARLFESPLLPVGELEVEKDLPGMSRLPGQNLVELGIDQIDAGLRYLASYLSADVALPDMTSLRQLLKDSPSEAEAIRKAILALHVELLTKLGDFRWGKSYGLGRALADTCSSSQSAQELGHRLDPYRALEIGGWLSDLKTLLPDHAAEIVSSSLETWVVWAGEYHPDSMDDDHLSETSRPSVSTSSEADCAADSLS